MKYALITLFAFVSVLAQAQTRNIAFYNVENLFDTIDDPNKNDNEFLPAGNMQWNSERYLKKIEHINQVMDSLEKPMLFGMCEIENAEVVKDVINYGNYKDYELVHYDSRDDRGIDNAMIYDPSVLTFVNSGIVRYDMPAPDGQTRDIVWAKFTTNMGKDTILAMVNHWPSRRGGQAESEPKRMIAAFAAKQFIDSVQVASKKMKIVFMGDLNDYPENTAPQVVSKLLKPLITKKSNEFGGSHSYKNEWGVLDHMMVSKSFLKGKTKAKKKSGTIYSPKFLQELYNGNIVPFRTYGGSKYLGGYSDHFPVVITVKVL